MLAAHYRFFCDLWNIVDLREAQKSMDVVSSLYPSLTVREVVLTVVPRCVVIAWAATGLHGTSVSYMRSSKRRSRAFLPLSLKLREPTASCLNFAGRHGHVCDVAGRPYAAAIGTAGETIPLGASYQAGSVENRGFPLVLELAALLHRKVKGFDSLYIMVRGPGCLETVRRSTKPLPQVTSIKASFSALLWSTVLLFAVLTSPF